MIKNAKRKGSRAEHRCMRILEDAGYRCTRAAASLGLVDVIAVGPTGTRCVQVKAGTKYLSGVEREQLTEWARTLPPTTSVELWRFPDRCHQPITEVLR